MFELKELLILVFAAVPAVLQVQLSNDTDYKCYANNEKPYFKFGTKTAYHFIHGGRNGQQPIQHCKPVQIWMLIRHGTRYPSKNVIGRMRTLPKLRDEIIENHEARGHGHLCNDDLDNLKKWRLEPVVWNEISDGLTEQGVEDMNFLGRRTRINFPDLFPPVISDVSSTNYKFRSANDGHVTLSKTAFMSGLFDRTDIPDADIPANDNLLSFYDKCPRWAVEVANNPVVLFEVIRFTEGTEYRNLILNVSRRLGFRDSISDDTIKNMWDMCRFDKAWKVRDLSPWCAVFSEKEFRVFEYREDLADYYKRAYGHEYNIRLGCPPMQHLFQHFEKLESDDYSDEPKGVFNVVRSGSLHLFMAAMGFAKDSVPPLASEFESMNEHKWRTSEIGSFAANVAAVFFKCKGITGSPNKVMFYIAEKPVSYEGCDGGLCDWEYLKNKFPNATSDCNYDFCHSMDPKLIVSSTTVNPVQSVPEPLWVLYLFLYNICTLFTIHQFYICYKARYYGNLKNRNHTPVSIEKV